MYFETVTDYNLVMRKSLGADRPLCHPDVVPVLLYLAEQESPVVMSDVRSVISNYDTVKKRVDYLEKEGLVETKPVKSKNTSVVVYLTERGRIVAHHLNAAERAIIEPFGSEPADEKSAPPADTRPEGGGAGPE